MTNQLKSADEKIGLTRFGFSSNKPLPCLYILALGASLITWQG